MELGDDFIKLQEIILKKAEENITEDKTIDDYKRVGLLENLIKRDFVKIENI